ncbi:hypothetical protein, partial [Escherichia coli]|uniref:hypothetical protein n=1 Tax=Escherichia coli TaxID=562 RepID=UPI001BFEC25B
SAPVAGYSACLTSFTSSIRFSLHAYNQNHVMSYLKAWLSYDLDLDELTEFAKTVPNWTTFKEWVSERIREAQEELPY